jgi:hypothetical protein
MVSLWKKTLFTAVFTIYSLIFYGLIYLVLSYVRPEWLDIPSRLDEGYVAWAIGLFSLIVFLSYTGAAYVTGAPGPARRSRASGFRRRPPVIIDAEFEEEPLQSDESEPYRPSAPPRRRRRQPRPRPRDEDR